MDGTRDGSATSTIIIPPRFPLRSEKYTASGLISARICSIFYPAVPFLTRVLKGSRGRLKSTSIRIVSLLEFNEVVRNLHTFRAKVNTSASDDESNPEGFVDGGFIACRLLPDCPRCPQRSSPPSTSPARG